MAVNRGGVAFWNACVRRFCLRRQPVRSQHRIIAHRVDGTLNAQTLRPLSSASWSLAPPNSLRYQNARHLARPHYPIYPLNPGQLQHSAGCHDDEWVESLSMRLVVRRSETDRLQALMEIPVFDHTKRKPSALSFPLTIVDGSGLDDISVGNRNNNNTDTVLSKHGCLFQIKKCPTQFVYGSHFYCFHCPPMEPLEMVKQACRLENLPLMLASTLCSPPPERLEEAPRAGDNEDEQKLALMYERLRLELPNFFQKTHDYSMYTADVEFISGVLNIRGLGLYRLILTIWKYLCLSYYSNARIEVLKLTKHPEDGTVKARWRLCGLPFYMLLRFYLKDKSQYFRYYDVFSTFYIGHDGLIRCHKVEKVMPAPSPILPRVTALLAGTLVALDLQEHRPALNLLPPLLSSLRRDRD